MRLYCYDVVMKQGKKKMGMCRALMSADFAKSLNSNLKKQLVVVSLARTIKSKGVK